MKRVLAFLLVLCGAVAICASPALADEKVWQWADRNGWPYLKSAGMSEFNYAALQAGTAKAFIPDEMVFYAKSGNETSAVTLPADAIKVAQDGYMVNGDYHWFVYPVYKTDVTKVITTAGSSGATLYTQGIPVAFFDNNSSHTDSTKGKALASGGTTTAYGETVVASTPARTIMASANFGDNATTSVTQLTAGKGLYSITSASYDDSALTPEVLVSPNGTITVTFKLSDGLGIASDTAATGATFGTAAVYAGDRYGTMSETDITDTTGIEMTLPTSVTAGTAENLQTGDSTEGTVGVVSWNHAVGTATMNLTNVEPGTYTVVFPVTSAKDSTIVTDYQFTIEIPVVFTVGGIVANDSNVADNEMAMQASDTATVTLSFLGKKGTTYEVAAVCAKDGSTVDEDVLKAEVADITATGEVQSATLTLTTGEKATGEYTVTLTPANENDAADTLAPLVLTVHVASLTVTDESTPVISPVKAGQSVKVKMTLQALAESGTYTIAGTGEDGALTATGTITAEGFTGDGNVTITLNKVIAGGTYKSLFSISIPV